MRFAVCQINTITADLEGNIQRCMDAINMALEESPDLIVLPEMSICGVLPMDILLDQSFVHALQSANQDFAWINRNNPPILFGSLMPSKKQQKDHPNLHNCALLANNGTAAVVSQQQILWNHDIHYDSRWFHSGTSLKTIQLKNTNILPLIGKDFTHYSSLQFADNSKKPELILALHNTVFTNSAFQERIEYLKDLPVPSLLINQVGGHDGLVFDGQSCFYDPQNDKHLQLNKFKTETVCISFPNHTTIPLQPNVIESDWADAICLGIKDFFWKNNISQAFVGVSGGIDSAVTAYLAQRALGPGQVTALSLPSRFNDPRSATSSQILCHTLHIKYKEISIEPIFDLFEEELKHLIQKEIVAENIQARIRAIILMAYVNFYGGVLLNTSNKTELSLGYGTLYGDLAGTLSPIGDLTKPEVYQLAKWINKNEEIIPSFILNRVPSAELRLNQVDPFDYPVISPQIENLIRNNQSNTAMRMVEHKRHQFGTIIKLSSKTFGLGRLIPITRK